MKISRSVLTLMSLSNLLTACQKPKPINPQNEILAGQMRKLLPGITDDCVDLVRKGGVEAIPDRVDRCFKMQPAQHWRGLWRREFEASLFCAEPARFCPGASGGEQTWLTFTDSERRRGLPNGLLYSVEFVGRRTTVRGMYGHMGVSQHEIVVDRMDKITLVDERAEAEAN